MHRVFITAMALTGLLTLSGCSSKTEADAATLAPPAVALSAEAGAAKAVVADAATPAADATKVPDAQAAIAALGAEAQSAKAAVAPQLPEPKIVVPPKPKPGAPHGPGFDMPLIELGGYAPPRPMDILKDAHIFTADHPEVASYIPCYCGCGSAGHKNNADCFVDRRDAQGRVTAWVPHGAACAVCIDIAVESMRMRNSGASVSAIRTQIQNEYRPHFPGTETPTPPPPSGR